MIEIIYPLLLIISLILFALAFTVFANTEVLGGLVIAVSLYLFLGSLIKICKKNRKLKNTFSSVIDLLFWLP